MTISRKHSIVCRFAKKSGQVWSNIFILSTQGLLPVQIFFHCHRDLITDSIVYLVQ